MAEHQTGGPDEVTEAEPVDEADQVTDAELVDESGTESAAAGDAQAEDADDVQDAELVEPSTALVPAAPVTPAGRPDLTLPPAPAFDYTDAGVPTLDYVRSKVEGRLGTAMGAEELARAAVDADAVEKKRAEQEAERARLAAEKLAEIRRSLGQG